MMGFSSCFGTGSLFFGSDLSNLDAKQYFIMESIKIIKRSGKTLDPIVPVAFFLNSVGIGLIVPIKKINK